MLASLKRLPEVSSAGTNSNSRAVARMVVMLGCSITSPLPLYQTSRAPGNSASATLRNTNGDMKCVCAERTSWLV
ncbi:MAG: hypothetical protein IPK07_24275 [Deltaproteobacteria bacterium]|nr:hypothetical protein [Deltaproteobacteria bacterium]